jgi:4-hydroxyphenylacetate 3-monooxygenase
MRTGAQYLSPSAPTGVGVYEGEVVRDVTVHPASVGAAHSLAGLFDVAADPKTAS